MPVCGNAIDLVKKLCDVTGSRSSRRMGTVAMCMHAARDRLDPDGYEGRLGMTGLADAAGSGKSFGYFPIADSGLPEVGRRIRYKSE